jgi:cytochrome P450
VLVGNWRNYGKATIQYRSLSLVTGEGLLTADNPAWRAQRPLVQPAFRKPTMHAVATASIALADQVAEDWSRAGVGTVVDVDAAMMRLALSVVGQALFGADMSGDAGELTAATLDALSVVIARARPSVQFPAWVPTPGNRRLATSVARLDAAVAQLLAGRAALSPDPTGPDAAATGAGQAARLGADMVTMLTNAGTDAGTDAGTNTGTTALTAKAVRDQLVTFIVAGHETVASTLVWAAALLSQDRQAQDRLAEEAERVAGGRPLGFADLAELTFARAVVDEALRLYPPAWLITRNSLERDELGGHPIPAGALVILSPWLLHRHRDHWDQPEQFDPDRFLTGRADREVFIPFGAGPRQCIGKEFAYVEAVLTLATLARRVTLAYPAGAALPDYEPLVTVRPKGGLHLLITEVRR